MEGVRVFLLTGMQVAVIGGDARQIEVIKKLSELDAKILLVGFDQLGASFPGAMKEDTCDIVASDIDAIVLPVSGVQQDGKVEAIFSSNDVFIDETFLSQTKESTVIYSGIGTDYLIGLARKTNRRLVALMDRDDVAIYNSVPTAEGVVMLAMQNTDNTIHGSTIAVLGLGRCGISLARLFHGMGAQVKVGVRKSEHLARVYEMGLTPFHLNQLEKEVSDVDICVNTIPALVVTSSVIAKMPLHTFVIDIATKPGGTDFRFAEKRGINAILAPGLPGIVAPKTAGKILANVLTQLLVKQQKT